MFYFSWYTCIEKMRLSACIFQGSSKSSSNYLTYLVGVYLYQVLIIKKSGVVLDVLVVFVGKAREVAIVLVVQLGKASCLKNRFIEYKHELFNPQNKRIESKNNYIYFIDTQILHITCT